MIRFLIAISILFIFSTACAQPRDSKLWIEDLELYRTNLEKYHIELYKNISKVEFEQELEQIKSNLNKKTDTDIIISLMRLTRKIGDGHTAFSLRGIETHLYPIEISKIEEQWRVIKTTNAHEHLLGKELIAIDGKTMMQIENEIGKVAQYVENEQSKVIRVAQYSMISELLYGLNLTNNKFDAVFSFLDDNKKRTELTLKAINSNDYYKMLISRHLKL